MGFSGPRDSSPDATFNFSGDGTDGRWPQSHGGLYGSGHSPEIPRALNALRSNHSQNEFSTTMAAFIEPRTTLHAVALQPSFVALTLSASYLRRGGHLQERGRERQREAERGRERQGVLARLGTKLLRQH
jgi:hypothetical protein